MIALQSLAAVRATYQLCETALGWCRDPRDGESQSRDERRVDHGDDMGLSGHLNREAVDDSGAHSASGDSSRKGLHYGIVNAHFGQMGLSAGQYG
jgi:hypothetical protein